MQLKSSISYGDAFRQDERMVFEFLESYAVKTAKVFVEEFFKYLDNPENLPAISSQNLGMARELFDPSSKKALLRLASFTDFVEVDIDSKGRSIQVKMTFLNGLHKKIWQMWCEINKEGRIFCMGKENFPS